MRGRTNSNLESPTNNAENDQLEESDASECGEELWDDGAQQEVRNAQHGVDDSLLTDAD